MPNWCSNTAEIRNDDVSKIDAIETFLKEFDTKEQEEKDKTGLLQFLIPNPTGEWDYGWSCENWGTKWDICSPWDTDEIYVADDGKETYVFKFDTAWSPPIPIYDAMMDQGFNLVARYVEYGCGYHGEYGVDGDFYHDSIEDGDEIDEHLRSEYA